MSRNYRAMAPARRSVRRARAGAPSAAVSWTGVTRRQIWARRGAPTGGTPARPGPALDALRDYAQAAAAWPLTLQPFKEALKVCLNA